MTDPVKIRQRLHNYLEIAEAKKLKAIYSLVQQEIVASEVNYTQSFKNELDRRYKGYKKDPSTAISATESQKRVRDKMIDARQSK